MQLIEVLGAPSLSGVQVVLSDGHTELKARLSSSVVDILEAELDEKLGPETTNDVFRLRRFTVCFTAVGPEDEWIQLTVDEIEYLYHRRRNIGQPTPVEQDSSIRLLITDRLASLIGYVSEAKDFGHDLQSQGPGSDAESVSVDVQRSSPPPTQSSRPLQRPLRKAAAVLRKESQPKHTLESDGFEIRSGVNLQGPVQPSRVDLLGLLKRQSEPDVVAETPSRPIDRNGNIRGHDLSARASASDVASLVCSPQRTDVDNGSQRSEPRRSSPLHKDVQEPTYPPTKMSATNSFRSGPSQTNIAGSNTVQRDPERFSYSRSPSPVARSNVLKEAKSLRSTRDKPHVPYGRRKIPANQRTLLNEKTSWLPPLPGHSFPKPNVPIELLKKWNSASLAPQGRKTTASARVNGASSQDVRSSQGSQPQVSEPERIQASSKSTSDDTEEADEVIIWSQSPPRPQPRPALPPDSPIGSVVRGTPDDLEVAPPRALKDHSAAPRAGAQQRYPDGLLSIEKHGGWAVQQAAVQQQSVQRHALPKRPDVTIPEERHAIYHQPQYPSTLESTRVKSRTHPTSQSAEVDAVLMSRNNAQSAVRKGPRQQAFAEGQSITVPPGALGHDDPHRASRDPPAEHVRDLAIVPLSQTSRASQNIRTVPLPPRDSIRQQRSAWREEFRKQEER